MKLNLIVLFVVISIKCYSQADSIIIPANEYLKEGIYLTHSDFRKCKVISKFDIVTKIDTNSLDFFSKLVEQDVITIKNSNTTYTVASKNLWGYGQNKTLYVLNDKIFYRVPVFGQICFLVALVEVVSYGAGMYDPFYGPTGSITQRNKEVRNFLMSYYNGVLIENTTNNLELLIANDKELSEEYKKLKKTQKKEQIGRFIRRYNEKHTTYCVK